MPARAKGRMASIGMLGMFCGAGMFIAGLWTNLAIVAMGAVTVLYGICVLAGNWLAWYDAA